MADFGLRIGSEGERDFKAALREINQSFKVLGSEMQLVTSQFDKNDKSVQSLTSRNAVLRKGSLPRTRAVRILSVIFMLSPLKLHIFVQPNLKPDAVLFYFMINKISLHNKLLKTRFCICTALQKRLE